MFPIAHILGHQQPASFVLAVDLLDLSPETCSINGLYTTDPATTGHVESTLYNKQVADVTGKFRHGTESLGAAIDKMAKIAARADFEKTVALAESLVQSLERLAVLEEKGVLDKVIKAMSAGK